MGKLYIVGTPIGNLKDITYRAVETLTTCDLIAAEDTRRASILLKHYNIKTKLISYHKYNEDDMAEKLVSYLSERDMNIALISNAGTPCISDPGYKVVSKARERGIEVIPVPGPSAITTALSVSGIPINHFLFLGFLPKKESQRRQIIRDIKRKQIEIVVIYESPKRIISLAEIILEELPSVTVCFFSELTKMFEKAFIGRIEDVLEELRNDPKVELGEYTVVIYNKTKEKEEKPAISEEALIIDTIVREGIDLKEAIKVISKRFNIPKNQLYKKALRLKELLR